MSFRLIVYGVLATALVLRLIAYAARPSLSIDEAQLSLNVISRSFSGLGHQLDFNQGAPLAFLESLKATTSAFGTSELALRLFPFMAGLLAVLLFYRVASQILGKRALIVATLIFSFSTPLILFATTAKQYSSDVLVGLILYVLGLRALYRPRRFELLVFGVVGAAAVWFSYPAAFVLAGITIVLAGRLVLRRERNSVIAMSVVTLVLLLSFGGSYLLAEATLRHLRHSVEGSLAAPNSLSPEEVGTFLRTIAGSFRYLLGIGHLPLDGLDLGDFAAVIFAMLCFGGFLVFIRRRQVEGWLLALPLVLAFCAMAVARYPLWPRMSLFAVPSLVILLANGVGALSEHLRGAVGRVIAWSLTGLCLAFIITPGLAGAIHPSGREALRPLMKSLATDERQDEGLYVYHSAQYAFSYYLKCRCLGPPSVIARAKTIWPVQSTRGADQWAPALRSSTSRLVIGRRLGGFAEEQIRDLVRIPRRRAVWIILADLTGSDRELLLHCLDRVGTLVRSFSGASEDRAARAYLYAFPPSISASGACR